MLRQTAGVAAMPAAQRMDAGSAQLLVVSASQKPGPVPVVRVDARPANAAVCCGSASAWRLVRGFGLVIAAVWCWLRTVTCMRSFRGSWLVAAVAVVVVLFAAACAGDDPLDPAVEPVADPVVSSTSSTVQVPVPTSVSLDDAEPVAETVAFSAGPAVQAWVASAWSDPASDPFGYDYSLWVGELVAPSADVDGLRAGPLTVSLVEVSEQDLGDPFLEKMSADLRSVLWLTAALDDGDDWRVFETDPGFAVLAVSESTAEAALAVPGDAAHTVFDGLHDPVTVHDDDGAVSQVLWPVVVDVLIQHTDGQRGLVHSAVRFGTTLLLVPDPAVPGGFLIESTAVPGGFMQYSVLVFPAP